MQSEQPNLETRIVGAVVIVVLLMAVVALYFFPANTDTFFAWTIKPVTTAMLIGEGYLAGAYFFVRVISEKKWQRVQAGFIPITIFTIAMLAATLLHWDRFHQGTFIFYLWTVIYAVTPFLVPFLWWRNRSQRSHSLKKQDIQFAPAVRWMLTGIGAAGILLGLAAFIWPSIYITLTPWKLTELTARIFAGWSLLSFATLCSAAIDGRWSSCRILLEAVFVGQVLTLFALPRMWNDFDPAKPMTYVFIGGFIVSLILGITTYVLLELKSRQAQAPSKILPS